MKKPYIIDSQQLVSELKSANAPILIDVSKIDAYNQAHLPNALFVDYTRLQHKGSIVGFAPERQDIQTLIEELGITPDSYVVAYDDEGGTRAARFLWVLALAGHKNFSYLNGGTHAWLAAGLPTDNNPVAVTPSQYPVPALQTQPIITFEEIEQKLNQPNFIVWDSRSAEEYQGITVRAQRAGHIPGAANYNWERAIDRNNNNLLRPLEDIRAELAALGITANKEVVVHCQTHHRSSFTWLLALHLGFNNVRGYAGSWQEWGNHPTAPIELATTEAL